MIQARIEYDVYLQDFEERSTEVLYDVDERPMMVRYRDVGIPLCYREWLPGELLRAIEREDYMYAAELRDIITGKLL